MGSLTALLALVVAGPPGTALPPGVTAIAGAQAEILRAERISAAPQAQTIHRTVRRVSAGLIVDFD
ncbi:MAG: hypothetical protein QM676_05590 [Novosphingobium sp.]